MPGTQTAPNAERKSTFTIHGNGAVKAYVRKDAAGVDQFYIEGIASSNVRDRQGDTITAQAQSSLLEQAKKLTMFLNHEYDVPEDVLGTCEESALETKGDIVDLIIRCKIAQSNPRAMKSWQLIKEDKVTLGFSVGGNLTEYEVDNENDDGQSWCPPLIINGMELFEISLCGIPANPRAYTRSNGEPSPYRDFVSEISRGFLRAAARSPEIRELVRKTLIRRSSDPPAQPIIDAATLNDAVAKAGVEPDAEKMKAWLAETGEEEARKQLGDEGYAAFAKACEPIPDGDETPADGILRTGTLAPAADVVELQAKIAELQAQIDETNAAQEILFTLKLDATAVEEKIAEMRTELEAIEAEKAQKISERDALDAAKAALQTQHDELHAECEALLKTLAELKATPTGRSTKRSDAGGSPGNGTANVDLTKLTAAELIEYKRKLLSGQVPVDGRSLAQ